MISARSNRRGHGGMNSSIELRCATEAEVHRGGRGGQGATWRHEAAARHVASGRREATVDGAAVAADAVRRLRNPFFSLLSPRQGTERRRGGPFCCCSCFPAFQDVVPEQAPRDGLHEAMRILDLSVGFPSSLTCSACFFLICHSCRLSWFLVVAG